MILGRIRSKIDKTEEAMEKRKLEAVDDVAAHKSEHWRRFVKTGSIDDYLLFSKSRLDAQQAIKSEEE